MCFKNTSIAIEQKRTLEEQYIQTSLNLSSLLYIINIDKSVDNIHAAISIKSGKVEYVHERLAGKPFALVFNFSALLGDKLGQP